jgi:hypothetical protein
MLTYLYIPGLNPRDHGEPSFDFAFGFSFASILLRIYASMFMNGVGL